MSKAPISAVVSSLNESHLLADCLASLEFCDELIVVNQDSSDDTAAVAQAAGAKLIDHERVPFGEFIHAEMLPVVKNQWMLITDPDERIDPALADDLAKLVVTIDAHKVGMVLAPMWYYFKGRRLKGTPWGGTSPRRMLLNQRGVHFTNYVHTGIEINPGFTTFQIPFSDHNVVHHFWIQSWSQLLEKHSRYLKFEGQSKYNEGYRFSYWRLTKVVPKHLYFSYIQKSGWRDGWLGICLSLFWTWYNFEALLSLRRYQKQHG